MAQTGQTEKWNNQMAGALAVQGLNPQTELKGSGSNFEKKG